MATADPNKYYRRDGRGQPVRPVCVILHSMVLLLAPKRGGVWHFVATDEFLDYYWEVKANSPQHIYSKLVAASCATFLACAVAGLPYWVFV